MHVYINHPLLPFIFHHEFSFTFKNVNLKMSERGVFDSAYHNYHILSFKIIFLETTCFIKYIIVRAYTFQYQKLKNHLVTS